MKTLLGDRARLQHIIDAIGHVESFMLHKTKLSPLKDATTDLLSHIP